MSLDSWEKYLKDGSEYHFDENAQRLHENKLGSWNLKGETLKQNYDHVRESEKTIKDKEVIQNVRQFYFSRNGGIILVISVVLCLITSMLSPEGIFFWNMILFMIVWGYHQITATSRVRPEWEEIQEEFETL